MSTVSEEAARQSAWLRDTDRVLAIVAEPPPPPSARPSLAAAPPANVRALWLTHPACMPVSKPEEDS